MWTGVAGQQLKTERRYLALERVEYRLFLCTNDVYSHEDADRRKRPREASMAVVNKF